MKEMIIWMEVEIARGVQEIVEKYYGSHQQED